MTILPLALFALSALLPAASATPLARDIGEDEMYCVFNTLDDDSLEELAGLVVQNGEDALQRMLDVADESAQSCAAKWNWTRKGRVAGSLLAAAEAGRIQYHELLKARFTEERLAKLFLKLSEADQLGFTFEGGRALSADDREALRKRFEAMLAREGVKPADYVPIALYFTASARGLSVELYWQRMGEKDER